MISVAASLAAGIYEEEETDIYVGAHGDDAAGEAYADCSPRFLKAMGEAGCCRNIRQGASGFSFC